MQYYDLHEVLELIPKKQYLRLRKEGKLKPTGGRKRNLRFPAHEVDLLARQEVGMRWMDAKTLVVG